MPNRTRPAGYPAAPAPLGARQGQAPAEGAGFPVLPRPGVTLGWCPFPTVKVFLRLPRVLRKGLRPFIFSFFFIHMMSTKP
jgi:hypothetical protein